MSNFTPSVQTVSITAGGKSQVLVAAADVDNPRQSVIIQPQTEACLINFGAQAGLQATGTLTVATQPSINDTIAINGVTFTFVASSASATQITIGADETETAANMVTILNASANASINIATYTSALGVVTIAFDTYGTDGNAYTLADSSGGDVTRSAATLAGGSNTVGGIALALNQIGVFDAAQFPQSKLDIYAISATDAAYISYLVGQS